MAVAGTMGGHSDQRQESLPDGEARYSKVHRGQREAAGEAAAGQAIRPDPIRRQPERGELNGQEVQDRGPSSE